jgi:ketosteroid isomerase-like protein
LGNDSIASDEAAVKAAVERFLLAIGDRDLDALPAMFTANANIGVARVRDDEWHAITYTFEEFHSMLKSRINSAKYQEPVSHFTVHVERGALAFVRADATLIRDGQPRSNNIDYFTLLKDDGVWKFLSASYVSTRIVRE